MQDLATTKHRAYGRLVGLRRLLWVMLSAYGLALTYFSHHFAPLAWVALIPFFLVIRKSGRLAAIGYGVLWGVVFFGFYGFVKTGAFSAAVLEFVFVGALSLGLLTLCMNLLSRRFALSLIVLGRNVSIRMRQISVPVKPPFGPDSAC